MAMGFGVPMPSPGVALPPGVESDGEDVTDPEGGTVEIPDTTGSSGEGEVGIRTARAGDSRIVIVVVSRNVLAVKHA